MANADTTEIAPPDRLSSDPRSPHFDADALERDVGIRFNGKERNDVDEYCVSEGWVRVAAGKAKDRFGRPMTIKLKGVVEAYFRPAATKPDG
jgi:hypothetical protein